MLTAKTKLNSRDHGRGIEKFFGPKDVCETKLLPGFQLACEPVFAAAGEPSE